jgi:hypothetical protein
MRSDEDGCGERHSFIGLKNGGEAFGKQRHENRTYARSASKR